MSIYHLNCGPLRPHFVRINSLTYCLLVQTNDGFVLVDTGFGTRDLTEPSFLMRAFGWLLRVPHDLEITAVKQVEKMGLNREDVRHIVMTHLHPDHAGGLPDFPNAQVHLHALELETSRHPALTVQRFYDRSHWQHGPRWVPHQEPKEGGGKWFGFDSIPIQPGLSPDIRLIPLQGHTYGHCGVAVETPNGWLLHCGDGTYPFYHDGHPNQPIDSPPDWLVRWALGPHTPRLKKLVKEHGDEVQLVCSTDYVSFMLRMFPDHPADQAFPQITGTTGEFHETD